MAMSKKGLLIVAFVCFLLVSMVFGTKNIRTSANPGFLPLPPKPATDPLQIKVFSPLESKAYQVTGVLLNISIIKPSSWMQATHLSSGKITGVYIWLDGLAINFPDQWHNYVYVSDSFYTQSQWLSLQLPALSSGYHTLTLCAVGGSYYWPPENTNYYEPPPGIEIISPNSTVTFRVADNAYDNSPPTIDIVSPRSVTYNTNNVALETVTDEPVSWIGYSLSGQANVTFSGNMTMIGFHEGVSPYVVVYANDSNGNMGKSDLRNFSIIHTDQPFPTPTPNQTATPVSSATIAPVSPSPTIAPSIEPNATPIQQAGFLGTNLPVEYGYALVAAVMVVVVLSVAAIAIRRQKKVQV